MKLQSNFVLSTSLLFYKKPYLTMYISCCNITGDINIKKLKQLWWVHVSSMLFVLITYTGVQHDFNITWCSSCLEVARQVPPVWHGLFTVLDHMCSPVCVRGGIILYSLYRGPYIHAFYQISVHSGKRFQRRIFFKIGQSERRIAYSGHAF